MGTPKDTTDGEPPDDHLWDASAPKPIDPKTGQHRAHWILPEAERLKGFVRPYQDAYRHTVCGTVTKMPRAIAETYARNPLYYSSTFCCGCVKYAPVAEFVWDGTNERVGS